MLFINQLTDSDILPAIASRSPGKGPLRNFCRNRIRLPVKLEACAVIEHPPGLLLQGRVSGSSNHLLAVKLAVRNKGQALVEVPSDSHTHRPCGDLSARLFHRDNR